MAAEPQQNRRNTGSPNSDDGPLPPWRTEGLPEEPKPPKFSWRRFFVIMLVGWLLVFGFLSFQDPGRTLADISYTEFLAQVERGNVEEIYARGQTIQGVLAEEVEHPETERPYREFTTERPVFAQDDLLTQLAESDAVVRASPVVQERGTLLNVIFAFLPIILLVLFYAWLFRRMRNRGGGAGGLFGGMGGKKAKPIDPEDVRVNFDDVAGIDEVKAEISEIVDFLGNPAKYEALGAKMPKGVLLEGGPGTGKTLLARATAGEAGVPFFSASAAEFIEMIVGVGAQRVRQLFEEARKVAPSIIFIDEIDTIGRSRAGSRTVGGNDEREQTLNQILTEMDGFDGTEGVVVIAATNRAEVLDDALTRAGRFDRRITVSAPDVVGREAILGVHVRGKPLGPDVNLGELAAMTPGLTGADLANLANEAALLAAKKGNSQITQSDFTESLEKVQLGAARSIVMPEEERIRTAYHEAGHALLGMLQPGADPVRRISIIPRGRALGVTVSAPDTDKYGYDREYLRGRIIGALGGMAAEEEIFGVVTTGAESDLETVTGIARAMVGRWGMSEAIGPVQVYPQEGDPRQSGVSEALLEAVDHEVRSLVDECYAEARRMLRENRDKQEAIVAALLAKETLGEEEAYAVAGIDRPRDDRHLVGAEPPQLSGGATSP